MRQRLVAEHVKRKGKPKLKVDRYLAFSNLPEGFPESFGEFSQVSRQKSSGKWNKRFHNLKNRAAQTQGDYFPRRAGSFTGILIAATLGASLVGTRVTLASIGST